MRLLAGGELLGKIPTHGVARVYSNQGYATVMLYEGHTVLVQYQTTAGGGGNNHTVIRDRM
jgi:hypothetical protein